MGSNFHIKKPLRFETYLKLWIWIFLFLHDYSKEKTLNKQHTYA